MVGTRLEAERCWKAGVQLMAVGVGAEVSGDVWAVQELRTVSHAQSAIGGRPRRMWITANFQTLANTRQPVTDALCASTLQPCMSDCSTGAVSS